MFRGGRCGQRLRCAAPGHGFISPSVMVEFEEPTGDRRVDAIGVDRRITSTSRNKRRDWWCLTRPPEPSLHFSLSTCEPLAIGFPRRVQSLLTAELGRDGKQRDRTKRIAHSIADDPGSGSVHQNKGHRGPPGEHQGSVVTSPSRVALEPAAGVVFLSTSPTSRRRFSTSVVSLRSVALLPVVPRHLTMLTTRTRWRRKED